MLIDFIPLYLLLFGSYLLLEIMFMLNLNKKLLPRKVSLFSLGAGVMQ